MSASWWRPGSSNDSNRFNSQGLGGEIPRPFFFGRQWPDMPD